MKGKTFKSNKGITLVALVVTIIVLLILAGVSINLVIGQNGIINRSKEATKTYDKAAVEEEVDLALATISMDHAGNAGVDEIYDALNQNATTKLLKGTVENLVNNGTSVTFEYKGYEFEIDADLKVGNNGNVNGALPSSFSFSVTPDNEGTTATKATITLSVGNPSDGTITNVIAPAGATKVGSNEGETKLASQTPMSTINTYKYEVTANGAYTFTVETSTGRQQTKTFNVITIAETETFSAEYTETKIEKDSQGRKYVVPKGFKVGTSNKINRVDSGLVIKGPDGSQWVWIPVNNISEMMTYFPKGSEQRSQGKLYDFSKAGLDINITSKTGNSETSGATHVTTWTILDDPTDEVASILKSKFMNQLHSEYADMAESVNKYKGFYIARYEASVGDGEALLSMPGNPVLENEPWEALYKGAKLQYTGEDYTIKADSVRTGMVWGSQWDQIMKYLKDVRKNVDEGESVIMRTVSTEAAAPTGNEAINNIYDIAANKGEYTIEVTNTGDDIYQWVYRGGTGTGGTVAGRYVTTNMSNSATPDATTRMQMYVK